MCSPMTFSGLPSATDDRPCMSLLDFLSKSLPSRIGEISKRLPALCDAVVSNTGDGLIDRCSERNGCSSVGHMVVKIGGLPSKA